MIRRNRGELGQVIVMVTLVLFAMVGMMGLAVDLGWSYFTKKSAQAAADSAALAAAQAAFEAESEDDEDSTYECGVEATCQAAGPCPAAGNLQNGCLYAQQNGFRVTEGGRQMVTMEADNTNVIPTAPGVRPYYWVTTRVSEGIPQLFSAILGNTFSLASARATAAIIDSSVAGSLILLNRDFDCVPMTTGGQSVCGVDLLVQANADAVRADGGILLASSLHGATDDGRYAGENQGGGVVRAPYTFVRDQGYVTLGGGADWIQMPRNGYGDRAYFKDPMRGKGQPPPPTLIEAPPIALLNGEFQGGPDEANAADYPPGSYYAVNDRGEPTGDQLTVRDYVHFDAPGDFGNYVFYGGLKNQSAGTVVQFDPGRYVLAGATPTGQNPKPLFDVQVNMTVTDGTATFNEAPPNAGEIFIFTDPNYPGLEVPPALAARPQVLENLQHGIAGFQTGNNAEIEVNIHGLNRGSASLPAELLPFSPVVLWQDQQNSVVKYTENGYIDTSCGNDASVGCPNTDLDNAASTEMFFKASPNLHIWGVAYQPRGAFTSMVGGGGYDSPMQLIAGALMVHGNANVRLQEINVPLYIRKVALVE